MKVTIGTPGLDVIKLGNFSNRDEVPSIIQYFRDKNFDSEDVKVYPKTVFVTIEHVTFVFGTNNSTGKPYINAEVKAGINGKNIQNMGTAEVWNYLTDSVNKLYTMYGIAVKYDWKTITVTMVEMNVTFPINKPFCEYGRIFQLVKLEVMGKKTLFTAEKKNLRGSISQDGLSCPKATVLTRIYNKSEEMKKDGHGIYFDANLMRVEFTLKQNSQIERAFKTTRFAEISDEMIQTAFRNRFNKIIKGIDDRLNEKMTLYSREIGADKTVVDIIVESLWQKRPPEWIISELSLYETMYHVPLILDIKDIRKVLSSLPSWLWPPEHLSDKEYANRILAPYFKQHQSDMTFKIQRMLYDEFKEKGQGLKKYNVTMYC